MRCGALVRSHGSFHWRILLTLQLLVTAKIEEGLPCFKSTLTNSVECRQDVVFYCQIHGVIFAGKRSTVHGHGLFAAVPLSLSGCFLGWRWILEFCFQCWWIIFKKHVREQASYKTEDPLYMCFYISLLKLCSKGDLLFNICSDLCNYIKTPVTRTLKVNEKQFDLAGNSSYRSKFQWNFEQGKGNLVWVSGEFELSEFQLWRFYCVPGVPIDEMGNRWQSISMNGNQYW